MAMTETQRTTLYDQLTGAIGQEAARTLMEQLPPSGWEQVATKDDLKASETRVRGELKEAEGRLSIQIADSESRLGARIDGTNDRIDGMNARIDGTNDRVARLRAGPHPHSSAPRPACRHSAPSLGHGDSWDLQA